MISFKQLGAIVAFTSALLTQQAAQSFCIHGINYNPRIGPDWAAEGQQCKSAADIQADMETLYQVTGSVRLYGLGDCDQVSTVLPAAINTGLSVSLGLWVSGDEAVFDAEFSRLQTLIQQHSSLFSGGSIVDIHVGSEAVYRKEVTAEENIAYLQRVKALLAAYSLVSVPVTIAEIGDVYLAHPNLIDAVDFVQANGFPFWEKIAVENAVQYFDTRMQPLYQQAAALGKRVEIGETGWASGGSSPKASEATPENAARYFFNFYQMAQARSLPFYYFEGFDEEWKITASNATVEGYFGLFHEDRTLKTEIANLALGPTCPVIRNEEASASTTGSNTNGGQTYGSTEGASASTSTTGSNTNGSQTYGSNEEASASTSKRGSQTYGSTEGASASASTSKSGSQTYGSTEGASASASTSKSGSQTYGSTEGSEEGTPATIRPGGCRVRRA